MSHDLEQLLEKVKAVPLDHEVFNATSGWVTCTCDSLSWMTVMAYARHLSQTIGAEFTVIEGSDTALRSAVEAVAAKWEAIRFYEVAAMQLRNSFNSDLRAALDATESLS